MKRSLKFVVAALLLSVSWGFAEPDRLSVRGKNIVNS